MLTRKEISLLPKTPTEKHKKQVRLFMKSLNANHTNQSADGSCDEMQVLKSSGMGGCSTHALNDSRCGNGIHTTMTKTLPKLRNSSVRKDTVPGPPRNSSGKMGKKYMTARRHSYQKSLAASGYDSSSHCVDILPQDSFSLPRVDRDSATSQILEKRLMDPCTFKFISLAKMSTQTAETPAKTICSVLVSDGVQTESNPSGEPACNCKQRVMVSTGVQTDAVFVIGVSESVLCRSLLDTDGSLIRGQPSSPASSQVLQLGRYFPSVENDDVKTDAAKSSGSCGEPTDDHCCVPDSRCLADGCEGQIVDKLIRSLGCRSQAPSENIETLSRWETSINLNSFSDSNFGAVAYKSCHEDDNLTNAAKSAKGEDKDVLSMYSESDQSGMSLAIELSKTRLSTAVRTLEQPVISSATTVIDTTPKSVLNTGSRCSPLSEDLCHGNSPRPANVPAISPSLSAQPTFSSQKGNDIARLIAAEKNSSQDTPDIDKVQFVSTQQQCKEDYVVTGTASRIPPPLPSRPPVGCQNVSQVNKVGCVGFTSPQPAGQSSLIQTVSSDARSSQVSADDVSRTSVKKQLPHSKFSSTVRVSGDRRQSRDVGRRSRSSAASRKSKGGPRLSVGRKSLSKRRSVLQPEKNRSTKLSRPAAWLLNATKSTKRKTKVDKVKGNAVICSADQQFNGGTDAVTSLSNMIAANPVLLETPSKLKPAGNSGSLRSKIQKLQSVFSPRVNSSRKIQHDMLPPDTPVVLRNNGQKYGADKVTASPARSQLNVVTKMQQMQNVAKTPIKTHVSTTSLTRCLSPGRDSSLEQTPTRANKVQCKPAIASDVRPMKPVTGTNEKNEHGCTIEKQASKRGLFHRFHGRVKAVQQENVPVVNTTKGLDGSLVRLCIKCQCHGGKGMNSGTVNGQDWQQKNSLDGSNKTQHSKFQKPKKISVQPGCGLKPEDRVRESPYKRNLKHSSSKQSVISGSSQLSVASKSTKPALNRTFITNNPSPALIRNNSVEKNRLHSPTAMMVTTAAEVHSDTNQTSCVEEEYTNYDITDICSDDSTDDESAPKRDLPSWARERQLMSALTYFYYHPADVVEIFGEIYPPDLNDMFDVKKPRFDKRTSSANWDLPLYCPYDMSFHHLDSVHY